MIDSWIEKTFKTEGEIFSKVLEMLDSKEAAEFSNTPQFLYSLAKVHSEAAFLLWQMQRQRALVNWIKIIRPGIDLSETEIVTSHLFPQLSKNKILILKNNKAFQIETASIHCSPIEKAMAFRKLKWIEIKSLPERELFSFESNDVLNDELLSIAAIIAGTKFKSFRLAQDYAAKRVQGGRSIKDWSSIQMILSELFLSVKVDEALMTNISVPTAYSIIKNADHFVSQNMQVLGGAGYMEDFTVERLYRECIFLKNWPNPIRAELIHYYQLQVRDL